MVDEQTFPDRVKLRIAGLHENEGRQILTNTGMGYEKVEYLKASAVRDALPDKIEIYRAIRAAGVRKHAEIAQVVADLYTLKETCRG